MNKLTLAQIQEYARTAHANLYRTTDDGVKRPVVIHIQEVADLVWASGGSQDEVTAAWLHDVVEDTSITHDDILQKFGKKVADIVQGLTDLDHFATMPLVERKQMQADRIKTESDSVKRVKMADQTSNVRTVAHDPSDSMTEEARKQYIHGAKLIADQCRGVSPLLDELFDKAYQEGVKRYG